jgi:hypothetical protein
VVYDIFSSLKGTVSREGGCGKTLEYSCWPNPKLRFVNPFFRLKIGYFKTTVLKVTNPLMLNRDLRFGRFCYNSDSNLDFQHSISQNEACERLLLGRPVSQLLIFEVSFFTTSCLKSALLHFAGGHRNRELAVRGRLDHKFWQFTTK